MNLEKLFDTLMNESAQKLGGSLIDYKVEDKDSHYVIKFYTPGFKKEELNLEVKDGRLNVTAKSGEDEKFQQLKIDTNVPGDAYDNILAKYEDGVLYITVPKANYGSKNISIM